MEGRFRMTGRRGLPEPRICLGEAARCCRGGCSPASAKSRDLAAAGARQTDLGAGIAVEYEWPRAGHGAAASCLPAWAGLVPGDDKGMWDAQVLGGGSRAVCLHRRGLPRSDGRELWRHRLLAIDQVLRLGLRLSLTQRRRKRCLVEVSCEGQRLHDPAVVPQFLRGDSHWLQRVRHGMGNRARPCRASGPHFVPAPHPGLCGEALGLHHPLTGAPADTEPRSQQFVGMNGREAEGWHAASPPAGCKARFNGPVRPGGRGSASPRGKVVARR
jgi:hypothetical protein